MSTNKLYPYACLVKLMNGKQVLRPYKAGSENGAKHLAGLRQDAFECLKAQRISEEQYQHLLSVIPVNKRDTSKRCPS
jgi:hypothetical protein